MQGFGGRLDALYASLDRSIVAPGSVYHFDRSSAARCTRRRIRLAAHVRLAVNRPAVHQLAISTSYRQRESSCRVAREAWAVPKADRHQLIA